MNKVSFVFQNSRLIKASILENVRMAKPDATREEIAHALEAAQCLDIIENYRMALIRLSAQKAYICPAANSKE